MIQTAPPKSDGRHAAPSRESRSSIPAPYTLAAFLLGAVAALGIGFVVGVGRPAAITSAASIAQTDAPLPSIIGQLGGATRAVALDDDHAYLGIGPRLRIYGGCDNPFEHVLADTAPLPGVVEDVAVRDGMAYAALGAGGVWAIDLANAAAPRIVGRDSAPLDFDGVPVEAHRVAVDQLGRRWVATNVGLVFSGAAGAQHLSAPDADAPPAGVNDVATDGLYGFVAWGPDGLRVFFADANDRVSQVGKVELAGAQAVAVAGQIAWVADGPTLRAFDILDPTSPVALGTLTIDEAGGDGRAIAVRGGTVFVAFAKAPSATVALAAIDGSDPFHPRLVQTEVWPTTLAQIDDGTIGGLGLGVAANARWAVIGGDTLGQRPVEIDRWLDGDRTGFAAPATEAVLPLGLRTRTDTPAAWLACGRDGVVPMAVLGEDANGSQAYMVRTVGLALDVAVQDVAPLAPPGKPYGRYALVAAGRPRVVGLEPVPGVGEQLLVRSSIDTLPFTEHLAVVGDVGVTVDGVFGFAVIDVADPLAPVLSATLILTDTFGVPLVARDIAVDPGGKRRAAIAAGTAVTVVDFSRRDQPRVLGVAAATGAAAIAWDVDRLWVATDAGRLEAFSLDDVGAPQRTATSIALPTFATDIAVRGGTLYAGLGAAGVAVYDVSQAQPRRVGIVDTPGWSSGIDIDVDGRVWSAERGAGAVVLDTPPDGPLPTLEPTAVPAVPTACPRPVVARVWLPFGARH
ncbi:MAG: hypothetical protein ABI780_06700 [Ardenticatenales bacterium]